MQRGAALYHLARQLTSPIMSELLNKQIVVKLNKNWQAFETVTVAQACTFLCSMSNGEHPGFAIDYETVTDSNGVMSLVYANPVSIDEWLKLPIREQDLSIGIGFDRETNSIKRMRVPLVIIAARYKDLPTKGIRWSPAAVRERDGGVCQVSKRKLASGEGNTGHIQARSKGGKDTFENTIYMDKRLNTLQGTKTPEEMGWKIDRPKAPKARIKVLRAEDAKHPSQIPFLIK